MTIKKFCWQQLIHYYQHKKNTYTPCKAPPSSSERYQLVVFTLLQLFLQLGLAERVAYLEVENLPVAIFDLRIKQWPRHMLTISAFTTASPWPSTGCRFLGRQSEWTQSLFSAPLLPWSASHPALESACWHRVSRAVAWLPQALICLPSCLARNAE